MVLLPQHGVFAQEKRLHYPKSSEPSVAKVDDWNLLIYLDQQTSIPLPAHQTPAVSTRKRGTRKIGISSGRNLTPKLVIHHLHHPSTRPPAGEATLAVISLIEVLQMESKPGHSRQMRKDSFVSSSQQQNCPPVRASVVGKTQHTHTFP